MGLIKRLCPCFEAKWYFSIFILEFNNVTLSVVGDISINSELFVMTFSISRFDNSTQVLKGVN